jgi:quinol monooxygenase YgiN
MTALTIVGRLIARAGQEAALREALLAAAAASREEPGCINYDLHVDRDDPGRFLIYENWVSEAALEMHFDQPHSRALAGKFDNLLAMPLTMERLEELTSYIGRKEAGE